MPRFRNYNWRVAPAVDDPNAAFNCEEARLAVLMDIREELQALKAIFNCLNVQRGFAALRRLARTDAERLKREKNKRRKR